MLIKEFDYHVAYKRWNDTFTAIPFKPKWYTADLLVGVANTSMFSPLVSTITAA
jgi:hypothetical protein